MIPVLTSIPQTAPWLHEVRKSHEPTLDYCLGGAGVGDTTGGLMSVLWVFEYKEPRVLVYRKDDPQRVATQVANIPGIIRLSGAFDQNMQPVLAYETEAGGFFRRYTLSGFEVEPVDGTTPVVKLDDGRPESSATSDVVLSYIRQGHLYCRVQREGYATEHDLLSGFSATSRIVACAPSTGLRLQWRLTP